MVQKKVKENAKAPVISRNPRAILIAVVAIVVAIVMVVLVYRNNQASKATHEELRATQKEFSSAETSFKKVSQELANTAAACEKSYSAYNLCGALTKAHDDIEAEYSATKAEVEAIDCENEETLGKAITQIKSSISTVQGLERKANDAITTYTQSLLKATEDEHAKLVDEALANLKETKTLLSTSKDKTSDEELWAAFARVLDVHEKEVNKQKDVTGDNPDTYIASNEILKVENAAVVSTKNHLQEIYESGIKAAEEEAAAAAREAEAHAEEAQNADAQPSQ